MSDSEECSNRLELDIISILVNFSCELGQIMTRYDFLWARWMILSNVRTDLTSDSVRTNFLCEFRQIMIRYDFLLPRWVILSNVRTGSQLNLIILLVNFSCELGQIMTRCDLLGLDEWFWAMFKPIPTWPNFDFGKLFIWFGENRWIFWEKRPL